MEFHEKLQDLRKQKGITQEELAEALYVTRAAVSKWESGRGYPNIDSLKSISAFFRVSIDELLSGDELLILAEEDTNQKKAHFLDLIFGLLDLSVSMFLFLPFFGQQATAGVQGVSLFALTRIAPYLKVLYYIVVFGMILSGVVTLSLQNFPKTFDVRHKISFVFSIAGVFLFVISQQPYAATFLLIITAIKVLTRK